MKKIKFKIHSLGCKVNQYDGAVIKRELKKRGFVSSDNNPELIIINTCTVTKTAITKDRRMINKYKRLFPNTKVIVMGCWPQTDDNIRQELDEDIIFWGVGKTKKLIEKIISLFPDRTMLSEHIMQSGLLAPLERSRYFIKIGDGCDQFCSYCIIPYARGRLNSRSSREIIEEIKEATTAGYREIVLSGIHLGKYKYRNIDLSSLVKRIIKINGLGRIRLSSIEINEVTSELIKLINESDRVCSHLHISLQSGCNAILRKMNRPYTKGYYRKKIKELRKNNPNIAITTDVIVGFPGETDNQFQETLNFVKEIGFSKVHVFSFSAHEKTPAYYFPNQISREKIKERSKKLREVSLKLETKYKERILKEEDSLQLIIENKEKDRFRCKTEFYFDLYLDKKELKKHIVI